MDPSPEQASRRQRGQRRPRLGGGGMGRTYERLRSRPSSRHGSRTRGRYAASCVGPGQFGAWWSLPGGELPHVYPYERLKVWQRAHTLAVELFRLSARWPDRTLRSQLQRASQSIPTNNVEGAGASTATEFARFLGIALASAHETAYHIQFAADIGLMPAADADRLRGSAVEIRRMLFALRRTVLDRTAARRQG